MRRYLLATTAIAFAVSAAAPAFAEFNERTIRVSNGINADHPVGNGIEAMQKCLDEKSGGKLKLQAFWGGALGGDLQATQALRSGVQEAVVTSSSPLVGIEPALGVFDLPFLFASADEAYKVLDGKFGEMMNEKLEAVGLVNLGYWENGFRNLSNSVRPVTKWEDFEGMKVRVMQNNIFLDTFQNLGANATPMAFGEVFSALETKTIDIIKQAGIDPVYFGVLFIMNCCIGLITPPVGVVLNVVSGVGRVPLGKVVTGIWPFLIAQVLVLLLLVLFPEIVIVPARWLI